MTRILCGGLFLAVAGLLAVPGVSQSVQLADGRVLLAEIEPGSVSGEGLRVKRLDNGGTLDLRWDHLSAASAQAWKKKFDLAGDTQDEFTVRADEVEYMLNGGKQRVIGRIVEQTPEALVVQAKGVPYTVKRRDLLAARKIDAPVTQVMTKDEFYKEQFDLAQPGGDADKHVQLAEILVKVRDYDHALEHIDKAKELGNSKNPPVIESMRARLVRFKEAAKELKLLEDIQACRSRGGLVDFEKGVKLLVQFDKEFPATKLKAEFDTEKRKFTEARTRFLTGQVADKWREAIRFVAEKQIADQSLTLQAVKDYATNKMSDDIVTRVVAQLRIEAAEVKTLWQARKDTPIGKRSEHFSYGVGSWVLGPEAIVKGTETGKAIDKQKGEKAPDTANDPQMDRLAKLLRQAMERRRQAVQGSPEGESEQTDEDWWRQAERAEKIGWLRSYYAEFGGQLVVSFASVSPCISCYAEGSVAAIGGDGKLVRNKCFLCQGTKWLRSFKAY